MLKSEDKHTRLTAIQLLGGSEKPSTAQELIPFLKDDDKDIRVATLKALNQLDRLTSHEAFSLFLDTNWTVRREAKSALKKWTGDENLIDAMYKIAGEIDWLAQDAIEIIAEIGGASDVE